MLDGLTSMREPDLLRTTLVLEELLEASLEALLDGAKEASLPSLRDREGNGISC